jgi:ABC-2 type transport system ATP-binding protein
VISSHLLADMEDVCDRIMLLHNGSCLAEGAIDQLLTKENSIRFTFNNASPEQLKNIKSAVTSIEGITPETDTPQTDLEKFFIKTISNATDQNIQSPSGVTGATALAPFIEKS